MRSDVSRYALLTHHCLPFHRVAVILILRAFMLAEPYGKFLHEKGPVIQSVHSHL